MEHDGPSDLRHHRLVPALLALALVVTYAPSLGGDWLNWDDIELLADPLLQQSAPAAITTAFTTTLDRAWYPLTRLLYGSLAGLGLLRPSVLHVVDLALFVAASLGLLRLLPRLGVPRAWAVSAVVLWALHPLRVESVAWAASTKDVLSLALAVAAGLAMWPAGGAPPRPVRGHLAWAAALLAKSAVFPLAGVFWAAEAAREGAPSATRRFGGFVALAILDAVIARWAFQDGTVPAWPDGLPAWALPAYSYGMWTAGILMPTRLAAIYPIPEAPLPWVVLGALAVAAPVAAAWRWGRPEGWAGVALWLLHPLPVVGLVPLAFWAADRYTLVISLAPALAVAVGLDRLRTFEPRAPAWATILLGVVLGAASADRARDWTSSLRLWQTDVSRPGEHFSRHQNLGWALGAVEDFDGARAQLHRAEALAPHRLDVRAQRMVTDLFARRLAHPVVIEALMPPPATPQDWAMATKRLAEVGATDLAREALATTTDLGAPDEVVSGLDELIKATQP